MPTQDRLSKNQTIKTATKPYNREDWKRGYESQRQETDYWIENIDGQIPPELNGTLFRNGPGLMDINGQPIAHPFDGDGMVVKIAFKNGRSHFSNRFVRTEGFIKEQAAGKILYRGVFGTQKPGGWLANLFDLKLKNIANTNVIYWGKKLLALWEGERPHRLDPNTLETFGIDDLEGILQPGEPFAAHPRFDPSCAMDGGAPCLVNFSVKPGPSSTINIYEFNPDGKLIRCHAHSLPGFAFLHDMAITENYCIFFQNPVSFNPLKFILGWSSPGQCIQFNPSAKTKVILIPRHGKGEVKIVETEPSFVFHHANAWEAGNEIFIDSICYDSYPSLDEKIDFREVDFDAIPPGQLWRFQVNLATSQVQHKVISDRGCEFPHLNPKNVGRSYRYLYIGTTHNDSGNDPLQAILKIDQKTGEQQIWSAAPRGFVGEPVFVPRPGSTKEDDGWLLVLVYDAANHRSDLVILDARNLQQEPIARLHLPYHIPYALHGNFTPEYFGPGV
jgi:all-trans-8'-apo-beta-carotenal 15,15'-oxygenase